MQSNSIDVVSTDAKEFNLENNIEHVLIFSNKEPNDHKKSKNSKKHNLYTPCHKPVIIDSINLNKVFIKPNSLNIGLSGISLSHEGEYRINITKFDSNSTIHFTLGDCIRPIDKPLLNHLGQVKDNNGFFIKSKTPKLEFEKAILITINESYVIISYNGIYGIFGNDYYRIDNILDEPVVIGFENIEFELSN